jgi:hypothetical protein
MWSRRTGLKMKAGETMSVVVEHEPTYYKRSMVAYRAGDFIDIFGDEKGRRGSYCLLSVPYTKWLKLTGLRITDGKFLGFMIKRVEEVDDYS